MIMTYNNNVLIFPSAFCRFVYKTKTEEICQC